VLRFERELVATLVSPKLGEGARDAVATYVDESLRSMPEHLRVGVAAESLIFGAWPRLQIALGRLDRRALEHRVRQWKRSRFDPLRQYVRVFSSLVVFAENELSL
jgi:hypothetical protein